MQGSRRRIPTALANDWVATDQLMISSSSDDHNSKVWLEQQMWWGKKNCPRSADHTHCAQVASMPALLLLYS